MNTTQRVAELMARKTVYVPERFIDDCIDCDCLPVPTIEHPAAAPHGFLLMARHGTQGGGQAEIAVDAINLAELVSRAKFYAAEPELASTALGKSAAKTLTMLTAQGVNIDTAQDGACELRYGADR